LFAIFSPANSLFRSTMITAHCGSKPTEGCFHYYVFIHETLQFFALQILFFASLWGATQIYKSSAECKVVAEEVHSIAIADVVLVLTSSCCSA
jgi:hypothetical protein